MKSPQQKEVMALRYLSVVYINVFYHLSLFKYYKSITPQLQVQLRDGSYSNIIDIGDVDFLPRFYFTRCLSHPYIQFKFNLRQTIS